MKQHLIFVPLIMALAFSPSGCAKKPLVPETVQPTVSSETAPSEQPAMSEQVVQEPTAASKPSAMKTIYFTFDSSSLSDEARQVLAQNAQWIKANPSAQVTLEGHTDERGSDTYNLALGERRATAAQQYLIALGVPADQLQTLSYGEEKPAATGENEAAWSQNRRVEFK